MVFSAFLIRNFSVSDILQYCLGGIIFTKYNSDINNSIFDSVLFSLLENAIVNF